MLLLIAECQGKAIRFPLAPDLQEVTIGSLPQNEIHVPYRGVSRHHFTLRRQDSGWRLHDLGSTNGTKVNGIKIQESSIKAGDVIEAGTVTFRVQNYTDDKIVPLPEEHPRPQTNATDPVSTDATTGFDRSLSGLHFPEGVIAGSSPKILQLYRQLQAIINSDISVLLIGETGTGKEVLAHTLHSSSKRAEGPFVAVNCAAIPLELMEAELFGIGERVATEVSQRKGKITIADGGTLFLDEFSAFSPALQPKVLRAIEEKAVTPVGQHKSLPVDFRLICATNEDPQQLIETGKLRKDLYHRVAAVEINIPPLRERKEDLPSLILGLLKHASDREEKAIAGISKELFTVLLNYEYPGNIRELTNLMNSMVALAHRGEVVDLHLAPGKLMTRTSVPEEEPDPFLNAPIDFHKKVDEFRIKLIRRALDQHNWNVSAAAKSLQVTAFGLRKMMKRLSIEK